MFFVLSKSKKNFVKTLLPLISYENQNILLERSKLESIKIFLNNNNTLTKSDLIFLSKISKKYRIKTAVKRHIIEEKDKPLNSKKSLLSVRKLANHFTTKTK